MPHDGKIDMAPEKNDQEVQHLQLGDIPDDLLMSAQRDVVDYTVGLVAVEPEHKGGKFGLVGTATFVSGFGVHGFLTAAHVVRSRAYYTARSIGMTIVPHVTGYQIEQANVQTAVCHFSENPGTGPDIAFVRLLSPLDIAAIEARKSFWNMEKYATLAEDKTVRPELGVWTVIGSLGERVRPMSPSPDFQESIVIPGWAYFSIVTDYWKKENHDYYQWLAHAANDSEAPVSFGGFSGGGLWQVLVCKDSHGKIRRSRARLVGVAFCEGRDGRNDRVIVCHGHQSIYSSLLAELRGRL